MAFIFDKLELGSSKSHGLSAHRIAALASRKLSGATAQPATPQQQSLTEHTPNTTHEASAEEFIELICGDHVVDPKMTLATLKQYYGSGGDMLLYYRPKKGGGLA